MTNPSHTLRRHFGQWCLAADPSNKLTGVLEETKSGSFRLELTGTLNGANLGTGLHRLLGSLENLEAVTLEDCHCVPENSGSETPRQTWYAHAAIFGAHIDSEQGWTFYAATFAIPGLTRWVSHATTGFEVTKDENGNPTGLGIFVPLKSWVLWSSEDCSVDLVRSMSTKPSGETVTQLESRVDVRAQSSRLLGKDDFQRIATRPIQAMLSLASGEFTAPTFGAASLDEPSIGRSRRFFEWRWRPLPVEFHHSRLQYAFHYSDVVELGASALERWARNVERFQAVIDLYLGVLQKSGFAELQFLMVAQALEVYHRITLPATILETTVWAPIQLEMKQILEGALGTKESELDLLQLKGKLEHLNDASLGKRLKELLNLVPENKAEICGGSRGAFVHKITCTRNFFTHWSRKDGMTPFERGRELFVATNRLIALLELLLLREIGFPNVGPPAAEIMRRRVSWL